MSSKTAGKGSKGKKPAVRGVTPGKTETSKGVKVQAKRGRPSKCTPELIIEVCQRLSKGEPLAQICRDEHMPDPSTIWDWQQKDTFISQVIGRAREAGEEQIALDCLNIADDNGKDIRYLEDGREVTDADVVQRAKLRIETRLKLLAKWNPKKWGDKVDMTSDGKQIMAPVVTFQSAPDA